MQVQTTKWALACVLAMGAAHAKTVRVPSDKPTINDALASVDYGDSVLVAPGVYKENVTLIQGVVLKGQDPINTIIDGGRRGPTVEAVAGGIIEGFTVRNGREGILCENAPAVIRNNWVMDNHASGIAAFISLPSIANNVVWGNRWSGILIWGARSYDTRIEHNVVLRNGFSGISLMGPTNVQVQNNIFLDNLYYGIYAEKAAGMSKVENNNIFHNYFEFNKFVDVPRSNRSVPPRFKEFSLFKPDMFIMAKSNLEGKGKGKCGGVPCDIGLVKQLPSGVASAEEEDKDLDDVKGADDKCPTEPEDQDGFEDEDGCPDLDNDKDNVLDKSDRCSNDKEDVDGFEDQDGCPDVDNDKDGLCDQWVSQQGMGNRYASQCKGVDRCANQAEVVNGVLDEDGCPDEKVEAPKAGASVNLGGINFKTGSAEITADSESELRKALSIMASAPESRFDLRGHTDNKGDKKKNKLLSEQRAKAVKDWLVANGVSAGRLTSQGMGQDKPIASNDTEDGRSKNRRIEFFRVQ